MEFLDPTPNPAPSPEAELRQRRRERPVAPGRLPPGPSRRVRRPRLRPLRVAVSRRRARALHSLHRPRRRARLALRCTARSAERALSIVYGTILDFGRILGQGPCTRLHTDVTISSNTCYFYRRNLGITEDRPLARTNQRPISSDMLLTSSGSAEVCDDAS